MTRDYPKKAEFRRLPEEITSRNLSSFPLHNSSYSEVYVHLKGLAYARALAQQGAIVTINGFGDASAIERERAGIEKKSAHSLVEPTFRCAGPP